MTDTIERVISDSGNFFGIACNTTQLVTEACRRHDVGPLAAAALGRGLTGAALLAALLKDNQSIQLKFEGNGPLKKVITEAGYDGWVRGYVATPHAELPAGTNQLDVAKGLGHAGLLTVVKNIGDGKRYPGTIPLYTSEIGEDLAFYLSQSEQTPSAVALSVHLESDGSIVSGGFLIQSLPPADESVLNEIEKEIANLPSISNLLMGGDSPAALLSRLFANVPHRKIAGKQLQYSCSCSREKMEGALTSLGLEDLKDLLEKEGGTEVRCEFCRQTFDFNSVELQHLVTRLSSPTRKKTK